MTYQRGFALPHPEHSCAGNGRYSPSEATGFSRTQAAPRVGRSGLTYQRGVACACPDQSCTGNWRGLSCRCHMFSRAFRLPQAAPARVGRNGSACQNELCLPAPQAFTRRKRAQSADAVAICSAGLFAQHEPLPPSRWQERLSLRRDARQKANMAGTGAKGRPKCAQK